MKIRYSYIFGGLSVFMVFAYGVFLILVTWPVDKLTIANAGVFGDSFGVLTSLFSALAFLGVALTLAYQKEESKLQKIELEENRKEMQKQGFENSFFQMLKLHNDIIDNFTTYESHNLNDLIEIKGRIAIKKLQVDLSRSFSHYGINSESDTVQLIEGFDDFYSSQGHQMAHYFRFLYNIFRFISESSIKNKDLYIRLVRAQISNQELYMLYYNALTPRGYNFQKYISEFQLMDNLPASELYMRTHQSLIPNAGFKC